MKTFLYFINFILILFFDIQYTYAQNNVELYYHKNNATYIQISPLNNDTGFYVTELIKKKDHKNGYLELTKIDKDKKVLWSKEIVAFSSVSYSYILRSDSNDNVYLLLTLKHGIQVLQKSFQNHKTLYGVVKINSRGKIILFKELTNNTETISDLIIDQDNCIITSGYNFNPGMNKQNYNAFISKYTSNGDLLWKKQIRSKTDFLESNLSIDNDNNIILAGFQAKEESEIERVKGMIDDYYKYKLSIKKLTKNGKELWNKTFLNVFRHDGHNHVNIVVDSFNSIFISGYQISKYQGKFTSNYNNYFLKINSNGIFMWHVNPGKFINPKFNFHIRAVTLSNDNNLIFNGFLKGYKNDNSIFSIASKDVEFKSSHFIGQLNNKGILSWMFFHKTNNIISYSGYDVHNQLCAKSNNLYYANCYMNIFNMGDTTIVSNQINCKSYIVNIDIDKIVRPNNDSYVFHVSEDLLYNEQIKNIFFDIVPFENDKTSTTNNIIIEKTKIDSTKLNNALQEYRTRSQITEKKRRCCRRSYNRLSKKIKNTDFKIHSLNTLLEIEDEDFESIDGEGLVCIGNYFKGLHYMLKNYKSRNTTVSNSIDLIIKEINTIIKTNSQISYIYDSKYNLICSSDPFSFSINPQNSFFDPKINQNYLFIVNSYPNLTAYYYPKAYMYNKRLQKRFSKKFKDRTTPSYIIVGPYNYIVYLMKHKNRIGEEFKLYQNNFSEILLKIDDMDIIVRGFDTYNEYSYKQFTDKCKATIKKYNGLFLLRTTIK